MIGKNAGELIKEENRKNQRGRSNVLSMRIPEDGKVQTFIVKFNCVFCDKDYIPDDYEYWMHRTDMKGFIELLKEEENKADFPKNNTKKMITFLRKIFYASESWDEHLINKEGATKVIGPYGKPVPYGKKKEPLIVDLNPKIEIDRNEKCVLNSDEKKPVILLNQTVPMEDGCFIDLGHTFAGLDAINYPHPVYALSIMEMRIEKNVDAVTWVGDLGSVLAEMIFHWANNAKKPLSLITVHKILRKYASPWDMLGNIDSYVIGKEFDIGATNGLKVSDIFKQYYLSDHPAKQKRYLIFSQEVGLEWDESTKKFLNEDEWISTYIDQVNDAAGFYIAAEAVGDFPSLDWFKKAFYAVALASKQNSEWLVKKFIKNLKECIKKEERKSCG